MRPLNVHSHQQIYNKWWTIYEQYRVWIFCLIFLCLHPQKIKQRIRLQQYDIWALRGGVYNNICMKENIFHIKMLWSSHCIDAMHCLVHPLKFQVILDQQHHFFFFLSPSHDRLNSNILGSLDAC